MDGEGATPVRKTEHLLQPPPGEAAAAVIEQIKNIQNQLTIERSRFSTMFEKQGDDFKLLVKIKQNLDKDDKSYLKLAAGQARVTEEDFIKFQVSLNSKNQDLLGYMEALDPNHEINIKEKVDSTIKVMQNRHVVQWTSKEESGTELQPLEEQSISQPLPALPMRAPGSCQGRGPQGSCPTAWTQEGSLSGWQYSKIGCWPATGEPPPQMLSYSPRSSSCLNPGGTRG